jgi:hypothetical protein
MQRLHGRNEDGLSGNLEKAGLTKAKGKSGNWIRWREAADCPEALLKSHRRDFVDFRL